MTVTTQHSALPLVTTVESGLYRVKCMYAYVLCRVLSRVRHIDWRAAIRVGKHLYGFMRDKISLSGDIPGHGSGDGHGPQRSLRVARRSSRVVSHHQ